MANIRQTKRSRKSVDRISSLSDDILCRILSLIPTKAAARTSVLSKRWERVWSRLPRFEVRCFHYNKHQFNRFMDGYFQLRRGTNDSIATFDLRTAYHGAKARVDSWMDVLASSQIKEFKFSFMSASVDRKKVHIYLLPDCLLRLSSVTILKLEGLAWPQHGASAVDFPSLKVISLEKIFGLGDNQLTALLSGSPSLEEILLKNCIDLVNPTIRGSSLKTIKISPDNCNCLTKTVKVEAENAEALYYNRGYSNQRCTLSLVSCDSIKYLSLSNASFTDWLLRGIVAVLPFLEELVLESCTELHHIIIESASLERLTVKKSGSCLEKRATVVAPKLAFFSYYDESLMGLSLMGPTSFEAEIKISSWRMYNVNYSLTWYRNLINFLANFDTCKELSIWIAIEKALIIPAELRAGYVPPLPTLKHLNLKLENPLFRKRIFRNSLSWISPSVETLTMEEKAYF